MPRLEQSYIEQGQVRYAARLLFYDEHSRLGVEAVYCAAEQASFWEMHAWLFEHLDDWYYADDVIAMLALSSSAELGLDGAALESCLHEGRYRQQVEDLRQDAVDRGIKYTPTFLINDVPLIGAQPFAEFQRVIEEELAQ
ncbi:MAG: thioredoxin domain-containing protein [Chloroflexia bacterium]|nr:thioredoxin domain-containing protein [Chloroflexia bacterium]